MFGVDPSGLCITLDVPLGPSEVCLPGGLCLSYIWDAIGKIPTGSDMCMDFFSQIGPAMAPLKPFFDILDTALAIYRCVSAIPDAIVSLDPSELLNCMPALAKAIDQLLKLLPYLSIPKMVKAILKNLAMLLRGIASDLSYIESQLRRIADAIDRASSLSDVTLNGILVCAQHNIDTTFSSTAEALKGIGRIILLVNILMGLFGGPEIPCFGTLLEDATQPLDKIIELLTMLAGLLDDIANMIPDPDLVLTLALGKQRC